MVKPKTEEEIALLRENGLLVSKTLGEVGKMVAPGVTLKELDKAAETFIRDHGAVPNFLNYDGYPGSICASVNNVVVHGIPNNYALKEGDIISIDMGTYMKGFNGDSAYTFAVGEVDEQTKKLLDVTKESLFKGIEAAIAGNRIGDIGHAVQSYAESFGFGVVRELQGHGIGRKLHENPGVPNYGRKGQGVKLVEGMTLCIEPMITAGSREVYVAKNGWDIITQDHRNAAHYELTVVVRKGKAELLSNFDYIEK